MIYCVVPEELAPELYDKLANYYDDDPNVKVIIDRRKGERRGHAAAGPRRSSTSARHATAVAACPRRVPADRLERLAPE